MRVPTRQHLLGPAGPLASLASLAPLGLLASLALTLTLLAACGATTSTGTAGGVPTATSSGSGGYGPYTARPTATSATAATATTAPVGNGIVMKVQIGSGAHGFAFMPDTVTVKAGTTVMWTNTTGAPHTVTSDAGAPAAFDSGTVNTGGGTFSFTFTKPGTYTYHCNFHSYMQGTIVVTP